MIVFLMTSVMTVKVRAHIELNAFYTSETLAEATSTNNTRMFVEGAIGFAIDKKMHWNVGWNYSMMNTTDSTSSTTTYASTQMGPRLLWFMNKDKTWSLGLGYYVVTNATFTGSDGTSAKWKGTAIKADLGYNYPIGETFFAGIRLNYSSASYNERIEGATNYTTVGYSKTAMYPSISTVWVF